MIFRRKRLDVTTGTLKLPAGISVVLTPDDFLSSLPSGFRDEVHGSYQQAQEALRLAQAAEMRVSALERRFTAEGTEAERLRSLEAEFDRLLSVLRSGHNVSFHRQETNP